MQDFFLGKLQINLAPTAFQVPRLFHDYRNISVSENFGVGAARSKRAEIKKSSLLDRKT